MNCIVIDDEPLAREAIINFIEKEKDLNLVRSFNNADSAARFLESEKVDIIFLDIQMPGTDGFSFAQRVPRETMVIFATAYSHYALESYEIDALDYLIKPIKPERFARAVSKAIAYARLLQSDTFVVDSNSEQDNYFFVRAERKVFKIFFQDILYIQGLKDYVVIYTTDQKVITAMNIKTVFSRLPQDIFIRTSKSYIVNKLKIRSFDNSTVYIDQHEIPLGNAYQNAFFEDFVNKKLLTR